MAGMHLGLAQSLELEQRLTQAQRIQLNQRIFGLRMELVQALRGDLYRPEGVCPNCGRKMTATEVIRGFNTDPNDFTTCCTGCGFRFEPELICVGEISTIRLPFYCGCQALHRLGLAGMANFSPEQLSMEYPAIYRSVIVHYGGIRQAFREIGVDYPFQEISDWRNKVVPFLGRLRDTIIAECVDAPVSVIRRMRKNLA
ncbi:hypothetical protein KJ934_00960 [Patescibacteria group bacterium]|nr:hypothetical protein [Patescibacteria group bacterium]